MVASPGMELRRAWDLGDGLAGSCTPSRRCVVLDAGRCCAGHERGAGVVADAWTCCARHIAVMGVAGVFGRWCCVRHVDVLCTTPSSSWRVCGGVGRQVARATCCVRRVQVSCTTFSMVVQGWVFGADMSCRCRVRHVDVLCATDRVRVGGVVSLYQIRTPREPTQLLQACFDGPRLMSVTLLQDAVVDAG